MAKTFPLSQSELGIYMASTESKGLEYNLPFIIKINKSSEDEIKDALLKIISNHNSLFTVFYEDSKKGIVKEIKEHEIAIPTINYPKKLEELVEEFDLENGPLFRFKILKKESFNYLFFDFHHLIMDGTSIHLFLRDLLDLLSGKDIKKEEYSTFDYSLDEEKYRESKKYQSAKEYYFKNFDGLDIDSIPVYDKNDEKESYEHFTCPMFIDKFSVSDFVKKNNIHTSSLFIAAYGYTLSIITGNPEALFLAVNNGRNDKDKESYGMFVHTFPVHTTYDSNELICDFLIRSDKEIQNNIKNDLYSYSDIVTDLDVKSEALFAYQGDAFYDIGDESAKEIKTKAGKDKLSIEVFRNGEGYYLSVEYRTDLFEPETIRLYAHLYNVIINEMISKKKLSDIDLVDSHTLSQMEEQNECNLSYMNLNSNVVEYIEKSIKANSKKNAVVFNDKAYTYSEIDKISNRIGNELISLGAMPNEVIPILINRNEFMVIASLGVIKTGSAYMPLDSTYPTERLEFMIRDSNAKMVLLDKSLEDKIPNFKGKKVYLNDLESFKNDKQIENISKPHDLFVMLYTSGTTGKPKGVQIENQNVLAFSLTHIRFNNLDNTRRVAAYASYGFDADLMDLYPTLISGATLYIVPEDLRLDLITLGKKYDEWKITDAFMTTTVGRQFLTEIENHHLINFSLGGEKLVPLDPKKLKYNVYNIYGPTEGVVYSNGFRVDRLYYRVPIGGHIDDYKMYVVNKDMKRVPYLVPGELVISGPQVARGYLNRPEANVAFIQNPFDDDPNFSRLYKTGDTVRMLPDGSIDFIGRADGQVKIRGFRIELTEVEGVIREFPDVKEATVKDFTDSMGIKYLVGYVVSDKKINFDEVKKFILSRKPPYMVPAYFMQIDAIPFNQNHKVNKRALPEPELTKKDLVPPSNDTEQKIFDIVKELVGYDVSVVDDLLEAGLTSVSMIKFVVLLSKAFNKNIKTSDLGPYDTIREIAGFISGKKEETIELEKLDDYPLSKSQEGIFIECFKNPNSTMYNIPTLVKLDKNQDLKELKKALEDTLLNHKYLMAHIFFNSDGEPRIKETDNKPNIETVKIDKLDKASLIKPFDIKDSNLYRLKIITTKEDNYLFMDFHHILFDGTSEAIFINDVSNILVGKEITKEELSGFEVAELEEIERRGEELDKAKEFYKNYLANIDDPTTLPKKEAGIYVDSALETFDVFLDTKLDNVKKYSETNKVSQNAIFNTVFSFALTKFSGKNDVYYSTIFNGRTDSRVQNTCTMLVHTLPVFNQMNEEDNILDKIKKVQEDLINLENNSIYSFGELVHDYSLNSDIIFAYQGDNFIFDKLGKYSAEFEIMENKDAKTPIAIQVFIENNKYKVTAEYDKSLYTKAYMESFINFINQVLNEVLVKSSFKDIELLTKEDIKKYEKFNKTEAPLVFDSFHKYIEKYAKEEPNHIAVIDANEKMTYKEFNEACNKVAHTIYDAKGRANDKTIMLMPRTLYAYVVREGILKSGTAFVPIDPKYPDDRISYIAENADAKFLISTKEVLESKKSLLKKVKAKVFTIEDIMLSKKVDNLDIDIKACDLAYMIYTSGSTGNPKGVMLSEGNLCNFVNAGKSNYVLNAYKDCGKDSVSCSFASFSFDASLHEECIPFALGHSIYIANEEDINNPISLAKHMEENHVDSMFLTPSYVANIIDFDEVMKPFKNLKVLVMGAETVPVSLAKKLKEHGVNALLINGYGPTEATVAVTFSTDIMNGTIGKPVCNTKLYICDKQRRILPIGAIGELVITGDSVGQGYYNLPEKTKEVYITLNGERAYCAGDMARYTNDGNVEFFGRLDNQVKLHGLRIELDEVENNILKYPGITRTKVIVYHNDKSDFLVAYFTAKSKIDKSDLINEIKKHLTPYMIPNVFMQLDSMPLTPNGKIDKKALPEPKEDGVETTSHTNQNTTSSNEILDIFKKALNNDSIKDTDDFFEVGGTSLLASKVTMLALARNIKIDYQDVFEYKTAKALSDHLGLSTSAPQSQNITSSNEILDIFKKALNNDSIKDTDDFFEVGGTSLLASKVTMLALARNIKIDYQDVFEYKTAKALSEHLGISSTNVQTEIKETTNITQISSLANNTIENVSKLNSDYKMKKILLAGSTGFLGIHILRDLLEEGYTVYALVRSKQLNSDTRLKALLEYYFDNPYEEKFGNTLFTVDGDVTDSNLSTIVEKIKFDTIINAAALVKHFAVDDSIERVNAGGAKNLADIATLHKARMIQISTLSVAGVSVDNKIPETVTIHESELDLGQDISNKYVHSKYNAEKYILESIRDKGLDAKIIRVGNLMGRNSDGEFQINSMTNNFMKNLYSYVYLHSFPQSGLDAKVDFTPIDSVAEGVIKLTKTNKEFSVFHLSNTHTIDMVDVIDALNKYGMKVDVVSDEEFSKKLVEAGRDEKNADKVSSLLSYNISDGHTYRFIGSNNVFSTKVLYRLGFRWPITDATYLEKAIEAIDTLGFFTVEKE